jgi:hypothetical protein
MVAEDARVSVGVGFERVDVQVAVHHLLEATVD